jgi:hypothetical protein
MKMKMRLNRISSTGTNDGRTVNIMLDKLICHVLKIVLRTNGLKATT